MRNNGLEPFKEPHQLCVHTAATSATIATSSGWVVSGADRACTKNPTLAQRSTATLPPLSVSWTSAAWIELTVDATLSESKFVHTSQVWIRDPDRDPDRAPPERPEPQAAHAHVGGA
eukprot:6429977-Prymnesium_polylepis.1